MHNHQGTQQEEALNIEMNLSRIHLQKDDGMIIDRHQEVQINQRKLKVMQKNNKNLTLRKKITFKKKQLRYESLKINSKVVILVIKLLLQYLQQTLGSCMKLVSFVQDFKVDV